MHLGRHVQRLIFCSVLDKSVTAGQIFIKDHNTKFHRNSTSWNRADTSSMMDGRTNGYEEISRRFTRVCRRT